MPQAMMFAKMCVWLSAGNGAGSSLNKEMVGSDRLSSLSLSFFLFQISCVFYLIHISRFHQNSSNHPKYIFSSKPYFFSLRLPLFLSFFQTSFCFFLFFQNTFQYNFPFFPSINIDPFYR